MNGNLKVKDGFHLEVERCLFHLIRNTVKTGFFLLLLIEPKFRTAPLETQGKNTSKG